MHPEQQIFCLEVKKRFPSWPQPSPFHKARVIDCGSLDVNGCNRYLFTDCNYTGIDVVPGPNVDYVCFIHRLDNRYDTVICTEALEHDMYWRDSLLRMVEILNPGGLLMLTCATGDRAEHGTKRCAAFASGTSQVEELEDYYGNLSEADIRSVIDVDKMFSEYGFEVARENKDLYFWGVRI